MFERALTRLLRLPIRLQLGLIALVLALPAALIILRSGLRAREEALREARSQALELAEEIAFTQQNLVATAEQLLMVLAQLPEVRDRDAGRLRAVLRDCLKLNDQYSNIFVADLDGNVWAQAVDAAPFNVTDRRYFQKTVESSRFSSGEYVLSRATGRQAFNFGYPVRDGSGQLIGVMCLGFNLERYRQLLEFSKLPPGTNYLLLDHSGVVLSRGVSPLELIGKPYPAELFAEMVRGSEKGTLVTRSMSGDARLVAYRKLRIPGEAEPHLYVRVGIPIESVVAIGNRALVADLALFLPFLAAAVILAVLFARRAIADRITHLQLAAARVAAGDLSVRVSEAVAGGELGGLASTFDEMARQIGERERARQLSEQLYRQIFDVESDALFLVEQETGRILEVNPAATRLLGYSRDELLSMRNTELSAEPEATRATTRSGIDGEHRVYERTHRRKDGSTIVCEVAVGFFSRDGKPVLLAALRDVTARKRAEQERGELAERLAQSQKMEAVGRLAGGVAHDFNNLLTVIGGHCDLLLDQLQESPPLQQDVAVIRNAASSAAALTRQLLAFSRKQVLRPRVLDLNESVRAAERMLPRLVGEDVKLETRLEQRPWPIRADPGQLEQVLMNLAANARDAMPGGGTLRIETSNAEVTGDGAEHAGIPRGSYALLAVSDTGHGIDPQARERIFEPFFTTKKEGKGTGLGLSTVYGIVQQSGGQIAVDSAPGRGTTFRLYFPRVEEEALPAGAPAAPREPAAAAAAGEGTVLVAEDSEGVRGLIRQVLRKNGYQVLEAGTGEEALEVAARHPGPLRLLVADVVLPGINGREAAERVKALRPGIPVLFVSGYNEDAVLAAGVRQAAVDFLDKPFTAAQLEQKVREMLGPAPQAG